MNKAELHNWLVEEDRQWERLLDQIGTQRMELPGVMGEWSFKDMVAHLNDWQAWSIARMRAAQNGDPKPAPPWPESFTEDDEVNGWIYEANRERPSAEVLDITQQNFDDLLDFVDSLNDDAAIEPEGHVVQLGDERFSTSEFFDHFHDDHEADVLRWLEDLDNQS
jgi:hypothetical protein